MQSQERGRSRARQAVATRARCWSCGRQLLIGIALAATVGGAGLALGEANAGEASVEDIRLAKHGDATRVVIDLSKPVSYRHVSLGEPPRLAIDLPEVDWTVDAAASKAVGLVQGFRFGQPRPGCRASSSTWRSRSRSIACSSCRRAARTVTAL